MSNRNLASPRRLGDSRMLMAYAPGDPYLAFAKQAGAVPGTATAESHPHERNLYKSCVLAVQYGMGEESLAGRIGQPQIVARNLLQRHRETYPHYWAWSRAAIDHALLHGWLQTVFGWRSSCGCGRKRSQFGEFSVPSQRSGRFCDWPAAWQLNEAS